MIDDDDGFEYPFDYDSHGRFALGFEASFGDAKVRVHIGATEMSVDAVKVSDVHEAQSFIAALRMASHATDWNERGTDYKYMALDELAERVKNVMAWAAKKPAKKSSFSHHGIHTRADVAICGRALRLGFVPHGTNSALFLAYPEETYGNLEEWNLPPYDASVAKNIIEKAVGKPLLDEWNGHGSMVFPMPVSEGICEAFDPGDSMDQTERGPRPAGWC